MEGKLTFTEKNWKNTGIAQRSEKQNQQDGFKKMIQTRGVL